VRELEGEKIDVLKYDPDPRTFIRNALLPAEMEQVVILDESKKSALAVVQDNQFSLAIGKQGLNVRLANRLVDWNIDVKTVQQFSEMDMSAETRRALSALFGDLEPAEEITRISELPGLNERLVDILKANGIEYIESLISMSEEHITGLSGITPDDARTIAKAIAENIEIVEEQEQAKPAEPEATVPSALPAEAADPAEAALPAEPEVAAANPTPEAPAAAAAQAPVEETYECPECGAVINPDMTACPNCGVGLSFEEDEGQDG
jgi:N utilization substance protein A